MPSEQGHTEAGNALVKLTARDREASIVLRGIRDNVNRAPNTEEQCAFAFRVIRDVIDSHFRRHEQ